MKTICLDPGRVPTPCFIIDKDALRQNLAILRDVQDRATCTILLALKGFAAWNLAPLIREYLPGVAASSPHEARLGREEFAGEVHTYSPAFSPRYFPGVVAMSDHIIFNSLPEWDRYRSIVRQSDREIQCGLRINPEHSEVETAIYDPCGIGSRLGVTRSELHPDKLDGISGFHFHNLCQLGADALQRTLAAVEAKFSACFEGLEWINFGGGHHITAPDYDRELLIKLVRDFQQRYNLRVILEPGEAVAIHTGVLTASVLDITKNGDIFNAILDISVTAHMPDVLEMPYRPEIVDAFELGDAPFCYRLGGMSCLAGDIVGDYAFRDKLRVGQVLTFLDMSHYSMVKTSNFNGVQLPSIATYEPSTDTLEVVREFGYSSYRDRLS